MAFQVTSLGDASEDSLSAAVDGLTYLAHEDDDMGLARLYAGQLGAQVRRLEALLRSADPNMRDVHTRLRN